jgi:RNA polymerase sigma-70 factor (ECF subfamily)
MTEDRTTIAVDRYLVELANLDGSSPSEPIVRALIDRSVKRLHLLCHSLLARSYPRLMQPPLNLQAEEMLSAVVTRLLKAMREVRPATVRQFFGLANQHMRWELNDLARQLDAKKSAEVFRDEFVAVQESSGAELSPNAVRMLAAIDGLPEEEREVFSLIRFQGMAHSEVAEILNVSTKTVQRRLNRSLMLLAEKLSDLNSEPALPGDD